MYIQKAEEILQPRRHIQQVALTNRDELDMAYESNSDIASIGNALYRSRTKQNRLSDWYDNVTKKSYNMECRPNNQSIQFLYVRYASTSLFRKFGW